MYGTSYLNRSKFYEILITNFVLFRSMMIPSTAEYPGTWAHCRSGDKLPLGALQAPDKFTSSVALWTEKEYTLGRAAAGVYRPGLDAWFPYGGWEYSASESHLRCVRSWGRPRPSSYKRLFHISGSWSKFPDFGRRMTEWKLGIGSAE